MCVCGVYRALSFVSVDAHSYGFRVFSEDGQQSTPCHRHINSVSDLSSAVGEEGGAASNDHKTREVAKDET